MTKAELVKELEKYNDESIITISNYNDDRDESFHFIPADGVEIVDVKGQTVPILTIFVK